MSSLDSSLTPLSKMMMSPKFPLPYAFGFLGGGTLMVNILSLTHSWQRVSGSWVVVAVTLLFSFIAPLLLWFTIGPPLKECHGSGGFCGKVKHNIYYPILSGYVYVYALFGGAVFMVHLVDLIGVPPKGSWGSVIISFLILVISPWYLFD